MKWQPHLMTEADWDTAQSRFLVPRYREAGSGATMARTSRLSTQRDLPVAGLIPGEDVSHSLALRARRRHA